MSAPAFANCRCPHCRSLVEVPSAALGQEFVCPQCRQSFRATAWVSPEPLAISPGGQQSLRQGPVFEHYQQMGFFTALVQTIKDVLFEPTQTFAALRLDNGYGLPFLYATLISLAASIASQIWGMLLQGIIMAVTGTGGGTASAGIKLFGFFGSGLLGIFCAIPQAPFYAASSMFIVGGVYHLMLMLFNANRHPFESTARAMAYACTPMILCLIPVVGLVAAPIWGMVTSIIALREAHETTTGIAVAAVLLPLGAILCCCCLVVMLIPLLGMTLQG